MDAFKAVNSLSHSDILLMVLKYKPDFYCLNRSISKCPKMTVDISHMNT